MSGSEIATEIVVRGREREGRREWEWGEGEAEGGGEEVTEAGGGGWEEVEGGGDGEGEGPVCTRRNHLSLRQATDPSGMACLSLRHGLQPATDPGKAGGGGEGG